MINPVPAANQKPLSELCKENKAAMRITTQAISEKSGVPINTVANFFSAGSKAPSVYTVGPICKAVGLSLDQYFGIDPFVDERVALKLEHTQALLEAERKAAAESAASAKELLESERQAAADKISDLYGRLEAVKKRNDDLIVDCGRFRKYLRTACLTAGASFVLFFVFLALYISVVV